MGPKHKLAHHHHQGPNTNWLITTIKVSIILASFKDHTTINIRWDWPGQSIPCELFLVNLKMPWRRRRSRCSSGPGEESSTSTDQGGKRSNKKSLQIWIILGDGMICHKEVLWNVTKISIIDFFAGTSGSRAGPLLDYDRNRTKEKFR